MQPETMLSPQIVRVAPGGQGLFVGHGMQTCVYRTQYWFGPQVASPHAKGAGAAGGRGIAADGLGAAAAAPGAAAPGAAGPVDGWSSSAEVRVVSGAERCV